MLNTKPSVAVTANPSSSIPSSLSGWLDHTYATIADVAPASWGEFQRGTMEYHQLRWRAGYEIQLLVDHKQISPAHGDKLREDLALLLV